jgi:hypothetical protein
MSRPKLDVGATTKRPYRLWDAVTKAPVRWRCYAYPRNAHMGALIEARWGKPGYAVEVYDIRTGALLGQYTRTPTSVKFTSIRRTENGEG